MKAIVLLAAVAALAGCAEKATVLRRGRTEIVIAPDASKATRFAAEEMRDFLGRIFDAEVPIATNARPDVAHVFVGASEWTARAGLATNDLARDAFHFGADGRDVYVVGRDDAQKDTRRAIFSPHTGAWDQLHEHATLFGVYELLEAYGGVRFYFPGELGTIVPKASELKIPNGLRTVAPDCLERNCSWYCDGVYFEGENPDHHLLGARKLQYQRNRMQSLYIPCCHGENGFNLLDRFARTHPEYFVQNKDGTRRTQKGIPFEGHLCHTSKVWDEIYADVLSYARGDGPEVRGIAKKGKPWPIMTFRRPWVDVMPQDGMVPCHCAGCRAEYRTNEFHYATELIWRRTTELARRLRKTAPDVRITQMAYTPYRRLPDFEIPDNVDVMVAEGGPWSVNDAKAMERQIGEIRAWAEKLGHPVWIWTYPGKYGGMAIPSVPNPTPRSYLRYCRQVAPWIFGVYAENENDRWFYNYLSNYVLGKFLWNKKVDGEALLDEHFRLMFGAAAQPMADFVREMEDRWVNQVASRLVEGALGPMRQAPSEYDLFTSIYSPDVIARWRRDYVGRARARVADGSLEARRIDLYAREFIDPLEKRARAYLATISVADEMKRRAGRKLDNWLVNGYMDLPPQGSSKRHYGRYEKGRWAGGWIGSAKNVENVAIVKDAPPGLPASLRMSVAGTPKTVDVAEYFEYGKGRFKPNTRYRFSVFVKLLDVKAGGGKYGGGVCFRVWDGKNTFYPKHKLLGTTDWINQVVEFTTGADVGTHPHTLTMYLWDAVGTVWFSGALLEELPADGAK